MNTITFGFYGEGYTDYQYIQHIVERAVNSILPHLETITLEYRTDKKDQAGKILDIAAQASGLHFLVIHLDADGRDLQRAIDERFSPGKQLVENSSENVNKQLIPIIPIRMSEAWMLVDFEAFRKVTKTSLTGVALGFPARPELVETIDAKTIFQNAVRNCQPGRARRPISSEQVFLPLATEIDLDELRKVPAYQQFEASLIQILQKLHLVNQQ